MNKIFYFKNKGAEGYITCPVETADNFEKQINEFAPQDVFVGYEAGKVPFDMLPEDIQNKAKSTLKAFDQVTVEYENGQFHVSTGYCIRASYGYDHTVCGYYKADELFTKEERRQNFIEVFGYAPAYL